MHSSAPYSIDIKVTWREYEEVRRLLTLVEGVKTHTKLLSMRASF